MPHTLSVALPPDIAPDEARVMLAAMLFDQARLSLGQAAELAGLSRPDFLDALGRLGVSPFQYDGDDLAGEIARAEGGA